jgi:2,5-dioxopentanoate dehydrogenase
MLIGGSAVRGANGSFRGTDAATGEAMPPDFGNAGRDDVERACVLAWDTFDSYRAMGRESRARFLEEIAQAILDLGDELIERTTRESGLPRGRIEGERARTVGQLRLFAEVVRDGNWLEPRIDPAMPDRKPLPRPDLRQRHIPLGPVAVFGASNFPLAFSVAGGDTASSLAAGCPVVVKGHPAHPGTSELTGRAVQAAAKKCDMPEGVFALLQGAGNELGATLVRDPRIKAVGFTGSRRGGTALMRIAQTRPEPIPVYAEMSSINPVFLLPHAVAKRARDIGTSFVGSLTLGAGQFCTNPSLVLGQAGRELDAFLDSARAALAASPAATMLTPGILRAYQGGVARLAAHPAVQKVGEGRMRSGPMQGEAALFVTDAASFTGDHTLADEVFGAASLIIRCPDVTVMRQIAESMEGQLTATLMMEPEDIDDARSLLPVLERRVGRIIVNGYPTGVEVSHAMVHGGPYPATSDGRSTSVGTLAIRRFLRPVCYQDFPPALLPMELQDETPTRFWRLVNGAMGQH